MAEALVQVQDLCKIYRTGSIEFEALCDVTFEINEGEFVALTGPSGSGKSTLMNLIGCLDSLTSGTYRLNGKDVSELTENERAEIRNTQLGFVFQTFNLLPLASAVANVELPLLYGRWDNRRERAMAALERVGLTDWASHRPTEMSGGQRQRVAIARALVTEPSVIMADEPTGNLDSKTGQQILEMFQELHADGATLIVVTHDTAVAAYAERELRMVDGNIVSDQAQTAEAGDLAHGEGEGE